jgi:hypothetical protein
VAALIFVAMAGGAVAIWEFTRWMRELGAPYWIWVICDAVAYSLFAIDVICAVFFCLVEGMKFIRSVWRDWKLELRNERA